MLDLFMIIAITSACILQCYMFGAGFVVGLAHVAGGNKMGALGLYKLFFYCFTYAGVMIGARVMHGSWPHGALSNLIGGQVLAVCFIGAFVCVAFYFMGRYKQHLDIL